MFDSIEQRSAELLTELLRQAGLPDAVSATPLVGRGFENQIIVATLADGRRVVLRRFPTPRPPEFMRCWFLSLHNIPAQELLAANEHASLVEYVPGEVLGDLIETGRDTDRVWRLVGASYRRVHDVAFPAGLATEQLGPDRFVLHGHDPVEELHSHVNDAEPGLLRLLPGHVRLLPRLHDIVDDAAAALRASSTSPGHGDIHMWNVMVEPERAVLIDWDFPRVGDPAKEIALLDKHASLFNDTGLPRAFFEGYGRPQPEPNTSIHRVIQTLEWAASDEFSRMQRDPHMPADLKTRHAAWFETLYAYVWDLPDHVERLHALTRATSVSDNDARCRARPDRHRPAVIPGVSC